MLREPQLHAALFFAENLRFVLQCGMMKKNEKQKKQETKKQKQSKKNSKKKKG